MNEPLQHSTKYCIYSKLAGIQNEKSLTFISQVVNALYLKEPMAEGDQGMLYQYHQAIEACAQQTEVCPETPPTKHISPREADMANLLRYAGGLTDRHLHLTAVSARTYAAIEYEAGQKPAEQESWLDKARALLPKLTDKEQEAVYWRINTMMVYRNGND